MSLQPKPNNIRRRRIRKIMRPLSKFDRLLGTLERWIITASILVMALLMSSHVVSNLLFKQGIPGTYEVTEMLIVIITFVGVGYAARNARHISMSAIYEQLSGTPRKILLIIISLGTGALMFYFAYLSADYVSVLHDRGRTSSALKVPLWIIYLALPIGFTLAGIQYVLTTIRNLVSRNIYRTFRDREVFDEIPVEEPPTTVSRSTNTDPGQRDQ
ncbi:MAG: TRAP transporter small permease [Halomonas sp.]|uniref:TRAP transporter small permease n=1 Tax=Halomonas sp. TaxID=1486246 RepID=UPI003F8F2F97